MLTTPRSVLLTAVVVAQATQATLADQGDERSAIEARVQSYTDAFNARDAVAVASHWTPEAVYTNPFTRLQVVGREAIANQFKSLFDGDDDTRLQVQVDSIEFLSPGAAIEKGVATLVRGSEQPSISPYTAVHLKRDGVWLLDRVTEDDTAQVQSNYERLKELEWMVGRWVDETGGERVTTECQWTRNKSFLTRPFTVSVDGEVELAGMQFVGWDAHAKRIRSWTFDSDGGFATSTWAKSDDGWHVTRTATLLDGSRAASVEVIRRVTDDKFGWRSVNRTLQGKPLPNIDEVVVVRSPK